MVRQLIVDYPDYHHGKVKPLNFEEFCQMYHEPGGCGIWRLAQTDARTGEVVKEIWSPKILTDNGAVNLLGSGIGNAANSNIWNNILITNNDGSTTLTTALAANATAVTSLAVAALPAAIPSGTSLQLGYGTGNLQTVVTSASAAQGATSITVTSFTVNATGFAIGQNVVPLPSVSDNPTNANLTSNATTPLSQYSGVISAGGFTYAATTGAGNRSVQVLFVFKNSTNGGSTPNGSYTSAWLVNVTSGASNATSGIFVGSYIDHVINTPMQCNNSNNITAQLTVKI